MIHPSDDTLQYSNAVGIIATAFFTYGSPRPPIAVREHRNIKSGDHTHQVVEIVRTISYKGAGMATPMKSLEGRCVQDADRLDAIGAIGIARCFAYGGHAGRQMYDPDAPPVLHATAEEYKASKGHSLNHFYEKLLLLKDRMNTATGKRLAEDRHRFMEAFVARFLDEWDASPAATPAGHYRRAD